MTAVSARRVGATGLLLALLSLYRRWRWAQKQCALRRQAPTLPEGQDLCTVGWSSKRAPAEVDHVVVGSGLSGLYLAALLTKLGRKVLVLEQHYVAGGCTHTFVDKGFEFDTGVHYVGLASILEPVLDFAAGRENAVPLQRMADTTDQVYDEVHVGKAMHRYRPGFRTMFSDLVAKFPKEKGALRRYYLDLVLASVLGGLPLVAKQFLPSALWHVLLSAPGPFRWVARRYVVRTIHQALDDAGLEDEELRGILIAQFGDHGRLPKECSVFLHSLIHLHYIQGGFYPRAGSRAIAEAFVQTIFGAGSSVLVRAPVSRILVEDGRAVGVEVKGKAVVRARRSVISAAGVEVTYRKLLDKAEVEKMGGPPDSLLATERRGEAHHVYGFFGFDGTSEELGLPATNIWSFPETDLAAAWQKQCMPHSPPEWLASDEAAAAFEVPCFISFPSSKEDEYTKRCPGKSVACCLTEGRAEFFTSDETGRDGKPRVDEAVRRRYLVALRNGLLRHFPQLRDRIVFENLGSPWATDHYIGHTSSYGLDQSPERFLDPSIRVAVPKVRGLFLTGQDVFTCGVGAQPFAAWLTLVKVLGISSPDLWLLMAGFVSKIAVRQVTDFGKWSTKCP